MTPQEIHTELTEQLLAVVEPVLEGHVNRAGYIALVNVLASLILRTERNRQDQVDNLRRAAQVFSRAAKLHAQGKLPPLTAKRPALHS